jgi:hypothetical protein
MRGEIVALIAFFLFGITACNMLAVNQHTYISPDLILLRTENSYITIDKSGHIIDSIKVK